MVGVGGIGSNGYRVLMDDQDLSGGAKGTSSKSGSISEDHKGNVCVNFMQQSLHPSGLGKIVFSG